MKQMSPEPATQRIVDPTVLRASGALLSAEIALGRLIDDEAVLPTGHDPTVLDLLTRLDQAPRNQLRAVELSRQLALSPSHISRTIDRAEAANLVARGPDPTDRRASLVSLAPRGREVMEGYGPRLEAILKRVVLSKLSEAEIDTLVELLGRIEAATREPSPDSD